MVSHADERIDLQYEFHLDLLRSDLGALIENYEAFETRVEDDVFALFLQHLEQGGAEPQGSLLLIDNVPHRVTIDQISSDRSLTLYLVPWEKPTQNSSIHRWISNISAGSGESISVGLKRRCGNTSPCPGL